MDELKNLFKKYPSIKRYDLDSIFIRDHWLYLITLVIDQDEYFMDVLVNGHIKQSINAIVGEDDSYQLQIKNYYK